MSVFNSRLITLNQVSLLAAAQLKTLTLNKRFAYLQFTHGAPSVANLLLLIAPINSTIIIVLVFICVA